MSVSNWFRLYGLWFNPPSSARAPLAAGYNSGTGTIWVWSQTLLTLTGYTTLLAAGKRVPDAYNGTTLSGQHFSAFLASVNSTGGWT